MEETAEVQVGTRVTAYRRAGRGTPVLLLSLGSGADWDELFAWLAREFRVIQPALPAGVEADALHDWLQEVIEGLGLDRPLLLADDGSMPVADGFVSNRPGLAAGAVSFAAVRRETLLRSLHALAPATRDD
jgi:hypothetical protein